ncbi:MAG: hypothetical protein OHK0046_19840 [Anaerolineae bacterium]
MKHLMLFCVLVWGLLSGITAQEDGSDDERLQSTYFYTYPASTGNRVVMGRGTFPNVRAVDLTLAGTPVWLVGAPLPDGLFTWIVALENGDIQGTFPDGSTGLSLSAALSEIVSAGTPPVFTLNEIGAFPEENIPADASPLTHPTYTDTRSVYVAADGAVVLRDTLADEELLRLPFGALPDARLVLNSDQTQAAVIVGATNTRYVHDVLGDDLEGAALMVLDLETGSVPTIIDLPGDEVFEGIAPIWADVDEDGTDDLITTVSSSGSGAQLRVYRAADGSLLASGEAIGQSNRWRHQLAWGAFGPNGENELVEVLTPHLGGVVGFYRYNGTATLERVAELPGYTSHIIGTRNLDMAVAGDFNGDGQPEIVLPDQARGRIAGLQRGAEGTVREVWTLPLEGTAVTNLAAITLEDGRLALAVGLAEGRLRAWLPS